MSRIVVRAYTHHSSSTLVECNVSEGCGGKDARAILDALAVLSLTAPACAHALMVILGLGDDDREMKERSCFL